MTAPLVPHVDRAGRTWLVPEGYVPGQPGFCRGCPALVLWARNPATGKSSPFDATGVSHFATCPQSAKFRRKG